MRGFGAERRRHWAPGLSGQPHAALTSALMRFARRAGGQVSEGCTDCLWGISWGLYSLSFVSVVRFGFCRHWK